VALAAAATTQQLLLLLKKGVHPLLLLVLLTLPLVSTVITTVLCVAAYVLYDDSLICSVSTVFSRCYDSVSGSAVFLCTNLPACSANMPRSTCASVCYGQNHTALHTLQAVVAL
jgi:hypothetical protein